MAQANTTRWLTDSPVKGLAAGAGPHRIHAAAAQTVALLAAALEPIARRFGPVSEFVQPEPVRRAAVARWLAACADAWAAADSESLGDRLIEPLGPERPDRLSPEARWQGVLREDIQNAGIGWVRAADAARYRFELILYGRSWTVVEHGWPADENDRQGPLVRAAGLALSRQRQLAGLPALELDDFIERVNEEALAYTAAHSGRSCS